MQNPIGIIAVVFLFLWPLSMAARSTQQTVYLAEMKNCPGKENLAIMSYNFTLERGNRTQNYVNGDIVLGEAFPNGFKGEWLVQILFPLVLNCSVLLPQSTWPL